MAEVQQNENQISNIHNDIKSAKDLIWKITLDWKLNWEDSEKFDAFLKLINEIEKKYDLSKNELLQNSKLELNSSILDFLSVWFDVQTPKDSEILHKTLKQLDIHLPESFINQKWLFKLDWKNIALKNQNSMWKYINQSIYDIKTWEKLYFSTVSNPTGNNFDLIDLSMVEKDLTDLDEFTSNYDKSVTDIVNNNYEKPEKKSSQIKTESKNSDLTEAKKDSQHEKNENSKINFSKAIDENNKKFPTDELKKEIFDKLGITWTLEFSEEVIQKIADFQTSKWLKVDWAIWPQTLHALWIENKTEKKSKKKLKHKESQNTEAKSKKEKHISNINLIEEINKLSIQDLLMKYNTDAEFKLNIINSKDNFKAFYQKTHNVESTSKVDANWLPIEPKETNLIAWESVNNLSSESQIIQFLNKEGFNAKPIEWKSWTYELDLVWLFDDSILKINSDLSMNFSTSKYEKEGKPKEFRVANIDELKTILKDINDLTIAKTNLNRLNYKNNPDNQFFHADKIKTYQDQVDAIKKYLDAK